MKTILNLKKSIFFVAALTTALSFTSCSDDDDPKMPSVTDVYGTYKGEVDVVDALVGRADEGDASEPKVTATVNNDTIYFENFPVDAILATIESEEDAVEIAKTLDKVSFKVGYKGELNQSQDSIGLTLDPKPLKFTYKKTVNEVEVEKNVEVTVNVPENENSAYSDKVLKFDLEISDIMLNGVSPDSYIPIFYSFDLNKQ